MQPRYSISIDINAPAERVFEVMADVERWHEWTASIRRITRKRSGPLTIGETATVRQPKLPPARWTVNAIDPGRSFSWCNRAPGLKVTGFHGAEPTAAGSRATLSLSYEGLFGGLLARMTEGITTKYIEMEAKGLKARAEDPTYQL